MTTVPPTIEQPVSPNQTVVAIERRSQASTTEKVRIHYLDNLRAIAMLLGVFLHAGLAYAHPAQSIWLATDPSSSVAVDGAIWFLHLFRMSLFFFLAGYLAKLVIERKGVKQFVWNRALRIAVTFAIFYPITVASLTFVIVFSVSYLENPQGLMGIIASATKGNASSGEAPPPTTAHLWFLYYLFFFAMVTAIFATMRWLRFDWFFRRTWCLALGPLLLFPSVWVAGMPLPAPESFVPALWPFGFYGLFYWGGWHVYGHESRLERLVPYTWHLLLLCIPLFVTYYYCIPVIDLKQLVAMDATAPSVSYVVAAVLTCYLSVLLTVAALLLGKRYLQRRSGLLSLISDASFWIYLVHLPIVLFLQTLLIPAPLHWALKLMAVITGTLLFSMATYLVFVRYTPIGWLLHGKRAFP